MCLRESGRIIKVWIGDSRREEMRNSAESNHEVEGGYI